MSEEPLIWTTKGNIPAASVRYETVWNDSPDCVQVAVRYFLIDGGELVREDAYVLNRKGLSFGAETAQL